MREFTSVSLFFFAESAFWLLVVAQHLTKSLIFSSFSTWTCNIFLELKCYSSFQIVTQIVNISKTKLYLFVLVWIRSCHANSSQRNLLFSPLAVICPFTSHSFFLESQFSRGECYQKLTAATGPDLVVAWWLLLSFESLKTWKCGNLLDAVVTSDLWWLELMP